MSRGPGRRMVLGVRVGGASGCSWMRARPTRSGAAVTTSTLARLRARMPCGRALVTSPTGCDPGTSPSAERHLASRWVSSNEDSGSVGDLVDPLGMKAAASTRGTATANEATNTAWIAGSSTPGGSDSRSVGSLPSGRGRPRSRGRRRRRPPRRCRPTGRRGSLRSRPPTGPADGRLGGDDGRAGDVPEAEAHDEVRRGEVQHRAVESTVKRSAAPATAMTEPISIVVRNPNLR